MFELKVTSFFSAAHSLREYKGECESVHGHNFKVEVTVSSKTLNDQGLVIDFKDLKKIVNRVISCLDHKDLNAIDFFKVNNPSSENIAKFIYKGVSTKLGSRCYLKRVTVFEQRDYSASYFEEAQNNNGFE